MSPAANLAVSSPARTSQRRCQSPRPTPTPTPTPTLTPKTKNQKAGPPLLELPLEVFLCIADVLPLHAWALLSQTCRALRSTLPPHDLRAKLRRLPRSQRMAFYAGLAHVFPDYLACLRCCRLHRVDDEDTPRRPGYTRNDCPNARSCTYHAYNRTWPHYNLNHNHVQLALKYTRQPDAYLRDLVVPYYTYGRRGDIIVATRGIPKIVAGRFFLESIITFWHTRGDCIDVHSALECTTFLCRHETPCLLAERWAAVAAHSGFRLDEWAVKGVDKLAACMSCRADIRMVLTKDRWSFRCWQDLGSEEETGHAVMARRYAINDSYYNWLDEDVSHMRQPRVRRAPGSVERLYKSQPTCRGQYWKGWRRFRVHFG